MKGALKHRRAGAATRLVAAALAAAAWLAATPGAPRAQEAGGPQVAYREVRPQPGSAQRGLLDVPAWLLWSFGAALVAAAGWALWNVVVDRDRSMR